jgi:hypothetical protein
MTTNCVIKIGADDCPICASMSEFDRAVVTDLGLSLWYVPLDDVPSHPSIRDYLVRTHLDSDGLVNIPIYILRMDDSYIGSFEGEMDRGEFKSALEVL